MKKSTQKFIDHSTTRVLLLKKYPEGSEVTMEQIESAYVELSTSSKEDALKKARGRHVFLRLVDEGCWKGSTDPYIRIWHGESVFEWAKLDTIKMGRGVRQVKGKILRYQTVSGHTQAIGVGKVCNLAEVVTKTEAYVKTKNR